MPFKMQLVLNEKLGSLGVWKPPVRSLARLDFTPNRWRRLWSDLSPKIGLTKKSHET